MELPAAHVDKASRRGEWWCGWLLRYRTRGYRQRGRKNRDDVEPAMRSPPAAQDFQQRHRLGDRIVLSSQKTVRNISRDLLSPPLPGWSSGGHPRGGVPP